MLFVFVVEGYRAMLVIFLKNGQLYRVREKVGQKYPSHGLIFFTSDQMTLQWIGALLATYKVSFFHNF